MKLIFSCLIIFISFGISAQTIHTFSIDQKGILLADSKNPYTLVSLIKYNLHHFILDKSFKSLDSMNLIAIQKWNHSNPKEKIALNSMIVQSNTPLKNKNGGDSILPLPDGTIAFLYKNPDTIYYSFDFNQIALKYDTNNKIPDTIQLLRKTAKGSLLLAEFPADLLYKNKLVTYCRLDPGAEKQQIDLYLNHVANTRIRFKTNGVSGLFIKNSRNHYQNNQAFFDSFLFDSLFTIHEQLIKLGTILRKPASLIYDTSYYSLTNSYGDDSLTRDPLLGDLINVSRMQVDTFLSVNEVHSLYKKQIISYNSKCGYFEIISETILVCLEDFKGAKLIIDEISFTPYPYSGSAKELNLALKYDLNNNPLRKIIRFYLPFSLITLEKLYVFRKPKLKKEGIGVELINM